MARTPKTLGSFAADLVTALGGKPNPASQKLFDSWQRWEGGWSNNTATYNPLNLTAPGSGFPTINSVGVVAMPNYQTGVQRTADLLRKGYPALTQAFASGKVNFNDPAIQSDLNRWLSGSRSGGMTPYVSKIASSFGQATGPVVAGTTGAPAVPSAPARASVPPPPARPTLDLNRLAMSVRDSFLSGGGRINLNTLPTLTEQAWVTPVKKQTAPPVVNAPAPTPGKGGGGSGSKFSPGSPIIGGSHGGEHGTSGLAGYSGIDYFSPAGSEAVAPVSGKVVRFSGHDPKLGAVQGAGGPLGWSMYIQGDDGHTYYLTHMGSRDVKVGQKVKAGQRIGTVADYDKFGRASHIHMGVL